MALKYGLLGLLNYGPQTGYALDKEFKASLANFWSAKTSQIYRELDTMEKSGWLTSQRIVQEEKPNKRVYTITELGYNELVKWIADYEPKAEGNYRNPYVMRIFFGGEVDKDKTIALLEKTKETIEKNLSTMEKSLKIIEKETTQENKHQATYWKLTVTLGETMAKAQLEWIENAIATLKTEGQEG